MKNFKSLTTSQKKQAIAKIIENNIKNLAKGSNSKLFGKLSESKQKNLKEKNGTLCGCIGCQLFIRDTYNFDSQFKEFIIGESQVEAETAYYKEADDTVIDVD